MARLNVTKLIENTKVDPRYEISSLDMIFLVKKYEKEKYLLALKLFTLGYAQGQKAKVAELKREGRPA